MKRIILILSMALSMSVSAQEGEVGFVCAPCGCEEDSVFHETAGLCKSCGMERFAAYKHKYRPRHGRLTNAPSKTVAIFIFPGVQIIDYTGPWEVFGQAGWRVFTVAKSDSLLRTAMGMQVKPHYTFENAPEADFLLVPGGNVSTDDDEVLEWLRVQVEEKEQTLSVCNGAYFLGAAGILDGKKATTFAPLIPGLGQIAPKAEIVRDQRFTDNGKILTSAGLSSGIDAAIHLVSKYQGLGNAQRVATHLEYEWSPNKGFVRAQLADMHISAFRNFISQYNRELLRYEGNEKEWTVEIAVDTDLTQKELMTVINHQAVKGYNWTNSQGNWKFQSDGRNWIASIDIAKGEGSKKILTFRIEEA